MACSQKQLEANHKNALKSTGPKTARGKAISSRNACKRGLIDYGDLIIRTHLTSEDSQEYEQLLSELRQELRPASQLQYILVERITNCLWRSRRILKAETAEINLSVGQIDTDNLTQNNTPELPDELDNLVKARSLPSRKDSDLFLKYEMRLDRQLTRAFDLLKKLQAESNPSYSTRKKIKKIKKNTKPTHFPDI